MIVYDKSGRRTTVYDKLGYRRMISYDKLEYRRMIDTG
jgi:hypothetical protein